MGDFIFTFQWWHFRSSFGIWHPHTHYNFLHLVTAAAWCAKHVTLPISNLDIVWNKFSYLSDLQGPWLVVIGRPHPVLAWPPVSPPERFQDCSQHFQRVAVHGHPSSQPNSTNVPPQGILHCPPWQREEGKEDSRNSHSKLRPAKLHSGVVGRRRW